MASGQFGIALESTAGTGVTVTKFYPVENATADGTVEEKLYTNGDVTASTLLPGPPKLGRRVVAGKCRMKLPNKGGAATLLNWVFGTVVTTGTNPYTHTYGVGGPLYATVQFAPVDATDTAKPFTHTGAVVTDWKISVDNRGWVILEFSWAAMNYTTATALASASYTAISPFTFVEGSLSVAGSPLATLNTLDLTGTKNLKTDRFVINNSRTTLKALKFGKWEIGGTAKSDFEDLTMVNAIAAATALAMVWTLTNGTETLAVTMNAVLDGDFPGVTTTGSEPQDLTFRANRTTSAAADSTGFQAVLTNSESSAA